MSRTRNDAPSAADRLRGLLERKATEAADAAVRAGGRLPEEELERLERLTRLIRVCGEIAPARQRRWPLAMTVGGTLLLVSLLLFTRVPETEVELELTLAELGFSSPVHQVLDGMQDLAGVGVTGLDEIHLPRSRDAPARVVRAGEGAPAAIHLTPVPDVGGSSVGLADIALPGGARVGVEAADGSGGRVHLSLQGAARELRIHAMGTVRVAVAGHATEVLHFASPRPILLRATGERVDLDIVSARGTEHTLADQLLAEGLALHRIEEMPLGPQRTHVRRVSTVRSGDLYFESLDGRARPLRPGEALRFTWAQGEIRRLELDDGHLGLAFHGRVRGMTTGSGQHPRSLMPTCLEWIRARHGLALLWGSTLYLLGVLVALRQWWRAA